MEVSTSRKVEGLVALPIFSTCRRASSAATSSSAWSLGERSDISYKVGELTVYEYNMEVLDGYVLLTNEEGLKVS